MTEAADAPADETAPLEETASPTAELLPFQDQREYLSLHMLRVGVCLERYQLLRVPPPGGAPDAGGVNARLDAVDARLLAIDEELAARRAISDPSLLPLEQLQERFELPDAAVHFLVAAAIPGLDLYLGRALLEAGSGGDGRRQPDVGFLVDLLARDPIEFQTLISALSESGPLVRYRLIRLGQPRGWVPEGPTLLAPVAVPERVIGWLRGETSFEGLRFGRSARLLRGAGDARLGDEVRGGLERAMFREQDGRYLPLLVPGPALSGKATAVRVVAAHRGLPTLEVDLEALAGAPEPVDLLDDLLREARLQGAVLLLRHGDALGNEKRAELRRAVVGLMNDGNVRVVLTLRGSPDEIIRLVPGAHFVRFALPHEEEQHHLWTLALPPGVPLAADLDTRALVQRYRLTPGDILEAGSLASGAALRRGPEAAISMEDVVEAIRQRLRHRLGDVADLVTTTMEWSDLVLRDEVMDRIYEVIASVHYDQLVMQEWGFGRRIAYGRALSALFSGPPGTGKTMIAALIAKELGLELFRVDLSRVVSKWVGETEKNLGLAFDEAKNAQAILLFDEADSLFGKRTEVRSSNDRYANLEVNYLLQRIEAFEGIVLLTTNKESAIDEAFRRRLRFRIPFPPPDADERELLWRSMIPSAAPLAPDVDFGMLAQRFEMTGGYIKNAVVRAAYLAASSTERMLTQEILVRAAGLEWEEMGKLAPV